MLVHVVHVVHVVAFYDFNGKFFLLQYIYSKLVGSIHVYAYVPWYVSIPLHVY